MTEKVRSDGSAAISRRSFTLAACGIGVLFGIGALHFVGEKRLLRPPGGQDEAHLISACIRCQKCFDICPHDIIVPAHIEDGLVGMRTPTLTFDRDYCDMCADKTGGTPLCVQVCPTGALTLPDDGQVPTMGKAELVEDWCLAYRLTGCHFCYDACPYEAMELDGAGRPRVLAEKCNGCGACETVCTSLQEGSIVPGTTARAITIQPLNEEVRR